MRWKDFVGSKALILLLAILMVIGTISTIDSAETHETVMETQSKETLQAEDSEIKNKTSYMYRVEDAVDVGDRTSKEIHNTSYPEGEGNTTGESRFRVLLNWYMYPSLAGNLKLNGTSNLNIWARADAENIKWMQYDLIELHKDGSETHIGYNRLELDSIATDWTAYQIPLEIDSYTVSEGSSLRVRFELEGGANTDYNVAYGGEVDGAIRDTNVTLPCMDYMRVSGVHTEDSDGEPTKLFDPNAEDKNITINANITDPFGGYNIEWVNLTLEGPDGIIFENESMKETYGYFDSYVSEFEFPWNYEDNPEGTYDITVRAVDKNGMIAYEQTGEFGGHEEYRDHSFVIGGLDHYVNLQLEDDHGELLINTMVNLKVSDDVVFNSTKTDEEGIVNFTVAEATYIITVEWQDTEVSTNSTIDVNETGSLDRENAYELTAGVYYPELEILDQEDVPVQDANVYMTHPNGTTRIEPMESDDDGLVYLERYAEGDYSFEIFWKGRNVGEAQIEIDSSDSFEIYVEVYHLDVNIVDQENDPMSSALLVASYEDTRIVSDSRLSDEDGFVPLRLPATEYYFEMTWNDATVYEDTYVLEESAEITLTTEIFEVTVSVEDTLSDKLTDASVTAIYEKTGKEIETNETDAAGETTFRLAEGNHTFYVEWVDVEVGEVSRSVDQDNKEFDIVADVYQLEIQALDSTDNEEPIQGAEVSVYIDGSVVDTGETDDNGIHASKLPRTEVDIEISWYGIDIAEESHEVEESKTKEVSCSVYELDVEVIDDEGESVEDADLRIEYQGELITTGRTNEDGLRGFRLPEEGYDIEVRWRSFEVGETETIIEEGQNQEIIETSIYHVDFILLDQENATLEGADVDMIHEDSVYTSRRGIENGTFSVLVPSEDFTLNVDWQGVSVYEDEIQIEESGTISLNTEVYYVTFTGEDSEGYEVDDLVVSIYHQDLPEGQDYLTTVDSDQEVRIPRGEIEVVGEWRGFHVGEESFSVEANEDFSFQTEIYYLEVDIVDSEGRPLNGAELMVRDDDGVSFVTEVAEEGAAVPRLAQGEWELNAFWRGEMVGEECMSVPEEEEIVLTTDVHYLTVEIDDGVEPIEGVELTLFRDGEAVMTARTDENGSATFEQIVAGEYDVRARLRTTQFWTSVDTETSEEVSLHQSEQLEMSFEDYPLPVYTTNLFYALLVLVAVLVIGIAIVMKKKEVI